MQLVAGGGGVVQGVPPWTFVAKTSKAAAVSKSLAL